MSEIALAFLEMSDGPARQTCVGCTEFLLERGMVEVVNEMYVFGNLRCCTRVYRIRHPFTLEGCRRAIKDRHVGKPWGD